LRALADGAPEPLISLKEAKAIAKGRAAQRFEVTAPDAKAAREQTRLSQGDWRNVGKLAKSLSVHRQGLWA